MKRRSDSLGAFMSICRSTEDHRHSPTIYSRELETMMESFDEDGSVEETGHIGLSEKKRRLGVGQVKALEKNFEVENKLEPERKVKLAQELGLQPRQVAVWFQNRRARWKTKQLERDYGVLQASYDSLKINFDELQRDNETLLKEIKELKSKLNEDTNSDNCSNTNNLAAMDGIKPAVFVELPNLINYFIKEPNLPSDSDSSAILNEEINSIMSPICNSINGGHVATSSDHDLLSFQPQFVKIEEHNFFGGDETCDFFSDEQAPTLQWCYPDDQWT